jgi:hypothetical protein
MQPQLGQDGTEQEVTTGPVNSDETVLDVCVEAVTSVADLVHSVAHRRHEPG